MRKEFYIVGDYFKDNENGLETELSLSDFSLAYVKDFASDITELAEQGRAILGIATITDETKEAFIESVKTAGIPEGLRNLCITFDWPFDNDFAEFIEDGCEKYGINPDELEML